MIPVIGTAVLKNPKWVRRLYESIDFPVENFVVFNNNSTGEITEELESLKEINQSFVKNIFITHLPANLGVSAVWNLIIKSYINKPYWVIVNDDVAFTDGFLEEMYQKAQDDNIGMVHGYGGDFGDGAWDLFLIKDWVIQKLGLFDENLTPAYCEDADYTMRIFNNPFGIIFQLDKPYLHGDGYASEYYTHGSQTKKSSPYLTKKLDDINLMNFEYLTKKWGEGWRMTNPIKNPMGISEFPLSYTTFDIEFIRKKQFDI